MSSKFGIVGLFGQQPEPHTRGTIDNAEWERICTASEIETRTREDGGRAWLGRVRDNQRNSKEN